MDTYDTDVLVVGAGPAGLTAALALATYGVRVQVITRYGWLSNTPRAHITNQRAMEVFRDLGVEEEMKRHGSGWDLMGDTLFTTSFAGPEIARIRTWGTGDGEHGSYVSASPCPMLDLPQPLLESVLLRHAAARGAKVRLDTEYLRHTQDGDGVKVRLRDRLTGEELDVRCRYLVGADGARSQIAEEIGLPFEGQMARATTAYVQFRADLARYTAHRPSILYWILTPSAGYGEIGMGLLRAVHPWDEWIAGWGVDPAAGEPDLSEPSVVARIREMVGDPDLEPEIVHTSTWHVNQAHATRYHAGRVFCAGDAVHRHPPSGGLGSNTCVQDAYNLAWKLSYVIKGWAGPDLLESYSTERVPVGEQIVRRANRSRAEYAPLREVLRTADPEGTILDQVLNPGPAGAAARDALAPALRLKHYEFNAHGIEHNQRYRSAAVLAGDEGEITWEHDPELVAQPSSIPGAKLPHAWLVGKDGRRVSTLDRVGGGLLTVLTGLSGGAWAEATSRLDRPYLRTVVVDTPDQQDLYRDWYRHRDIPEAGALLVRPDGYVAWRHAEAVHDAETAEPLLRDAIDRVLALTDDRPPPTFEEDLVHPRPRTTLQPVSQPLTTQP